VTVGYVVAFLGGILTLASPCSAFLLPSFFAYAFPSAGRLLLHTLVFYVGLVLVLVPLGLGSGAASQLVYGHRQALFATAGGFLALIALVELAFALVVLAEGAAGALQTLALVAWLVLR